MPSRLTCFSKICHFQSSCLRYCTSIQTYHCRREKNQPKSGPCAEACGPYRSALLPEGHDAFLGHHPLSRRRQRSEWFLLEQVLIEFVLIVIDHVRRWKDRRLRPTLVRFTVRFRHTRHGRASLCPIALPTPQAQASLLFRFKLLNLILNSHLIGSDLVLFHCIEHDNATTFWYLETICQELLYYDSSTQISRWGNLARQPCDCYKVTRFRRSANHDMDIRVRNNDDVVWRLTVSLRQAHQEVIVEALLCI